MPDSGATEVELAHEHLESLARRYLDAAAIYTTDRYALVVQGFGKVVLAGHE